MNEPFLRRLIKKPPVLFPLVALFHFFMLGFSIWSSRGLPFPSQDWVSALWIVLYTISWLFICDMKRWAALLYIALTMLNILLRFFLTSRTNLDLYTHAFFPIDILFCFFVLFYFKRFE